MKYSILIEEKIVPHIEADSEEEAKQKALDWVLKNLTVNDIHVSEIHKIEASWL